MGKFEIEIGKYVKYTPRKLFFFFNIYFNLGVLFLSLVCLD